MNKETTFYENITAKYVGNLFKELENLVSINSTYDEKSKDDKNPFGKGVSDVLNYVYQLAKKDGFEVNNYNNMIVEILTGKGDKNITIMAHGDVVPEGTGWEHDPFKVYEKDGILYARGVADDKGPLLASYYALKALKDNNLLGDYQVRFLVGGNEESGSLGMEHYFHTLKKPQPTLGFSPDASFPLIFAEKAIMNFGVSKQIDLPDVISLNGGVASNSVIEKCDVTFKNDNFLKYLSTHEVDATYEKINDQLVVSFHGLAAHGSVPWLGKNAGMLAIKCLAEFYNNKDLLHLYNCYNDTKAKGVNADAYSKDMFDNSLNVGLISIKESKLQMVVNFRFVETCSQEKLLANIKEASKPFDITLYGVSPLLYYPKDSVLIKTLLNAYQQETGDFETPILSTGGGTYAKEADNVVAFGMEFPGWDSKMHSIAECVNKKDLIKAMAIYARAIVELGKVINEN